jgi:hypothetical protein
MLSSFLGRSPSKNLILIQETATQLTLQRGEPRRGGKKIAGLEPQVIGAIVLAIAAGAFTISRHNQSYFASQSNPLFQWLPIGLPIVVAAISVAGRLGTLTHEVFTFDKTVGQFVQEGTSALGKRVVKQLPLAQIVDVELVEQTTGEDHDWISYGINLQLQSRKKHFLGWGDRHISGKQSAISLHHHRQLALQLRDFLLPQLVGQPLLDRTKGKSIEAPLSAIEDNQKADLDYAKEMAGMMFASKATKQAHIEKIRQLLAQNLQDPDANFKMAMALSFQKETQYDALPYLQRARAGYQQNGDLDDRLSLIETSIRQLEKKRR